ncbi:MAG: hypothetical protein G01um10143_677 [Parcubacteria group bacterium Gr01-1014_3]|nr:MAG: hypothetical protein G01um10143_677 [Parcubacteria group bacterium Gr01-1014_3]
MPKLFNLKSTLEYGWGQFTKNFKLFLIVGIVMGLVSFLPSLFAAEIGQEPVKLGMLNIVSWVLQTFVTIGLLRISLKLNAGHPAIFKDLWSGAPWFFKYFIGSVLYGVAVAAGLILLIIPGIILAVRLKFFDYLIIDKGMNPIEALKASWAMTKGHVWELFVLLFVLALINLAGSLILFVGLLVTVPVSMMATVLVYRKLIEKTS